MCSTVVILQEGGHYTPISHTLKSLKGEVNNNDYLVTTAQGVGYIRQ